MSDRIIAIGDVHGCAAALATLIEVIQPAPSDTLVMLGDCVDRGPDSRGVVDLVLKLTDLCHVVPLLGNHEEMVLAAADRPGTATEWLRHGGRQMLDSYGVARADELPREHLLFFRTWGDYWETPSHFFCHGSYAPNVPLADQEWGYQRWETILPRIPAMHVTGKTAVVGHTAQKTGAVFNAGHVICIDTYCHGGGWLTALDVERGTVWQSDARGQLKR